MNQLNDLSALICRDRAIATKIAWCCFLGALLWVVTAQPLAHAITINMEYTDEGDPVPHDENPAWDPDGTILKAHFNAAKAIWESLLPGEGEYTFDFHWDDDIDDPDTPEITLGLTSENFGDLFVELNSLADWFTDPTPNQNEEFAPGTQTLFSNLSPVNQSLFFPGTAPPGALEVGFIGDGLAGTPGAGGFNAQDGFDLLTVIVHEMGHVLGIAGEEPGEYNIYPQHVGGLTNVLVKEDEGGGHLAGAGSIPFLMCDGCGDPGKRRFPSATDVLVVAEDQGITDVHLARVGRIAAGDWSNASAWIGADVPDSSQGAYVTQGGAVLLDVDANVKSLRVSGGSTVNAQTLNLSAAGTINYDGGSLAVGIGGAISAEKFEGDPAALTTTAFSTVRFSDFTPGVSSTTAVTFNGNVGIGLGVPDLVPVTFDPSALADWNIAQNLLVGDQRNTKLVIDNGTWNVGGNLIVRGAKGEVAYYPSTVTVESSGTLNVTGVVDIGFKGEVEYNSGKTASNTTYEVRGGTTSIVTPVPPPNPPPPPYLDHTPGGLLIFEGNSNAAMATINVEGGVGDGGFGGVVIFRDDGTPLPDAHAADAEFWVKAGVGGVSLNLSHPTVIAGTGGRVQFEDESSAYTAHFRNDGVNDHGGSGGATFFLDDSYAWDAVFDNYGATLTAYHSGPAYGGRTEFFDNAKAWTADFNNHPGQGMGSLGAGITIFHGSSNANSGTFINKGGVPGTQYGGATEFYDQASAGNATFQNEIANGVTRNSVTAGNVRFYGNSTAGNATFYNKRGGGSTFFYGFSTAGDAHFVIEDTGIGFEGYVGFRGSSKGGTADLTIKPLCFACAVFFHDSSNAEQAEIKLDDGSQAGVQFWHSASMGHANIEIGSAGSLDVRNQATAANATIRIKPGGSSTFSGGLATAGDANVTLDGGTVSGGGGGNLFFSGGNAGNSTINVNGGAVSGAGGAQVHFGSGANAGTATVIAASGVAGAAGGVINLGGGTIASNARFTVGAGGFVVLPSGGPIEVGSIEGAGTIQLGHNELRAGALNTSTTLSGPIIGFATNPRLTKIGTGTLTLTGTNTYIGLTKVDGGTLVINGSNTGPVEVTSGATLKGIGTIGGTVTVNSGATFAPGNAGTSPNAITVGGLTMTTGGILDFELSASTYDRIITSGSVALAGILNVSLVGGFTPSAGSTFNLFDWGSVAGSFNTLNLAALPGGLSWNTSQLYTTGILSVAAAPSLPGDFNNDSKVDAADYVVWRKNGGTQEQFNTWRANFGLTAGSGSSAMNSSVPEPSSVALLAIGLAGFFIRLAAAVWPGLHKLPHCRAEIGPCRDAP
jgi:autotransporter-associated beta strand protein